MHKKLPGVSEQVPSCKHGLVSHSATSWSQVAPWNPGVQPQEKEVPLLLQTPLFLQGEDPHQSTWMQPVSGCPEKPGEQVQTGVSPDTMHSLLVGQEIP